MLSRADSELRWLLAAAAVVFLGGVAIVAALGAGALVVLAGAGLGALILFLVPLLRFSTHPYSARGFLAYAVTVLVFQAWNAAAFWIGVLTSGPRAVLVEATAALALVAGALWMSRALRTAS